MPEHDDELATSQTEGFKVGEKKTIEEYKNLDQNDESLNRWKASLGLNTGDPIGDPNDPRKCIIKSLAIEAPGRADITLDLTGADALESLKDKPFTIKEGAKFYTKVEFAVNHDVLSGLKYVHVVKRKGITVTKDEEMLGSYAPSTTDKPTYTKRFHEEEAPSGMLARGSYSVRSRFIDDDKQVHLEFQWSFNIAKDWAN
ncbi:Rho GDP-dissociation inhibitor [Talaromyces islandicus]|uniref:Rho GDP-dissociation inhibitor n=1 Tax=Talaromyces islandicus TaxID=28573 RepID=A0A0U1LMM2_TALIS|nr:Rho GDP-dissociation inhibitor [Talaromyces islandicus]